MHRSASDTPAKKSLHGEYQACMHGEYQACMADTHRCEDDPAAAHHTVLREKWTNASPNRKYQACMHGEYQAQAESTAVGHEGHVLARDPQSFRQVIGPGR